MAYSELLAQRVRNNLTTALHVEEKKMMGGLTFMVDEKMCVGVLQNDLMARIDPQEVESALTKKGCRPMDLTGRPMKGFVFIGPEGTADDQDLRFWLERALLFNKKAKVSVKRKKLSSAK